VATGVGGSPNSVVHATGPS